MTPVEVLKKYWGYDSFRPLQEDIITSVLSGKDTLGLMPTGGGKSITFQVPALILDGITIVITPLISLMKDQVDNLNRKRIKAVFFYSGMTRKELRISREKIHNAGVKLIYTSPERLQNPRFLQEIRELPIKLIVVDEAHCISQWGYDFRPAYLHIHKLRKIAHNAPLLALTATATPEVAEDICMQLEMKNSKRFVMSFSRNNINYIVRPVEVKINEIFHILSRTSGSAIIYVRSRRKTREIADFLTSAGISAAPYHAGLDYDTKAERQNNWKLGYIRVIVATNAFGMGIDKPDVRVVIHYDMPPSLEEYYQEAGRAGRDGATAYAVLLVTQADKGIIRRRVTESFPDKDVIRKIYERVCNHLNIALGEGYDSLHHFNPDKFCEIFNYKRRLVLSALHILARAGYLEFLEETEHRSRLMMEMYREELYNLRGISSGAELLLTTILRMYTGLFSDYVYISEERLANTSGLSREQVYEALLELARAHVLNYIPQSGIPYIYLPTSREEPKYLEFPRSVYEDRKKAMSARVEKMVEFAYSQNKCREHILLDYFGEVVSEECTRCDVCRTRKKKKKSKNEETVLISRILDLLKSHPHGLDFNVISMELKAERKSLGDILSFLIAEGYISSTNNTYLLQRDI